MTETDIPAGGVQATGVVVSVRVLISCKEHNLASPISAIFFRRGPQKRSFFLPGYSLSSTAQFHVSLYTRSLILFFLNCGDNFTDLDL